MTLDKPTREGFQMKLRRKSKAMFMGREDGSADSREQPVDGDAQSEDMSGASVSRPSGSAKADTANTDSKPEGNSVKEQSKSEKREGRAADATDRTSKPAATATATAAAASSPSSNYSKSSSSKHVDGSANASSNALSGKESSTATGASSATIPSASSGTDAGAVSDDVSDVSSATAFSDLTGSYAEVPPIGSTADFSGYDEFKYRYGIGDVNERDSLEDFLSGEGELGAFPLPEVFNAYPPEVQRKIMEWTDRDVKARRDDESRRQDEMMRAMVDRNRRNQSIPAIIIVLALVCGAITSIVTANPLFALVFMIVPVVVIVARVVTDDGSDDNSRKPPMLPRP